MATTLIALLAATGVSSLVTGSSPLSAFQEWLDTGGAETSALRVSDDASGRRGFFAARDISAGEIFARIPRKLLLTEERLRAPFLDLCGADVEERAKSNGLIGLHGGDGKELASVLPLTQFRLAATLLLERHLNGSSDFQPAIAVLPESYDSPAYWTDDEVELLRGSSLYSRSKGQRKFIHDSYRHVTKLCPAFGEHFSFQDFRWAVAAICSRVFRLTKEKQEFIAMVPFADMANHHPEPNTSWAFSDQSNSFEMKALADIPAGQEVFDSYGMRKDATDLIMAYGFVTSDNGFAEAAALQLPLCLPPSLADPSLAQARQELLGLTPLPDCCSANLSDEACFAEWLAAEEADNASRVFWLGKAMHGSFETSATSLARVLAHYRVLAVQERWQLECLRELVPPSETPTFSFALWSIPCLTQQCWPGRTTQNCEGELCAHLQPISAETELVALRMLRTIVQAHLDRAEHRAEPVGAIASSPRRAIIESFMQAEQNTLRKHVELVDFVEPLLKMESRTGLQDAVCELAAVGEMPKRKAVRRFSSYIDSVIAPLRFLPYPENGRPCGVIDTRFALAESCLKKQLNNGVEDMVEAFRRQHGYNTAADSQEL